MTWIEPASICLSPSVSVLWVSIRSFMASSVSNAAIVAFRRFCSSTTSAAASSPSPSSKSARKKNLVEVLQFLANWGVGAKVTKKHWQPETYYQLTRIRLGKDARHGSAWGIFYESGAPKSGAAEKIGGVNKRIWRYIREGQKEETRKV